LSILIQLTTIQPPEWEKIQTQLVMSTLVNNEQLKSLIMDYYLTGMIQTEIREEGPSEGDIECIIELLIEDEKLPDDFDSLLNQALSIFNIK
jgi:mRNA-degrading endonuclease YafQ of YafQ-DinJ toxin-antitoxin module